MTKLLSVRLDELGVNAFKANQKLKEIIKFEVIEYDARDKYLLMMKQLVNGQELTQAEREPWLTGEISDSQLFFINQFAGDASLVIMEYITVEQFDSFIADINELID